MNLRSLLGDWIHGLPEILQYMVVIAIVMLILYVCLALTRLIGKGKGEQVRYDNPEEYEKQTPDLFASTFFKRKPKKKDSDSEN